MRLLIATILLFMGVCVSAQTIPTSEQVEDLLRQGKVVEAKVALQQVLAVKPNSPKANYYMAQLITMEKGDASQYQSKYQPHLDKVAQAEAESNARLLKIFGIGIIGIVILTFAALFLPDFISNYKQKKRLEEKERVRLAMEEDKRKYLLKEILPINDTLIENIYEDEELAKQHRKHAMDAIEVLTKKDYKDLNDIVDWLSDVKTFISKEVAYP